MPSFKDHFFTHLIPPAPDEIVEADAGSVDPAGEDQRGADTDEDVGSGSVYCCLGVWKYEW